MICSKPQQMKLTDNLKLFFRFSSTNDKSTGFTLFEILIVLSIFAIVSLIAGQMLRQTIFIEDRIRGHEQKFGDLLRAMQKIEQDFEQITLRGIKNISGENLPALSGGQGYEYLVEFTRRGWSNPLGYRRSQLQRVAYDVQGDVLYRFYWQVLDRAARSQPIKQVLLENITFFDIQFINEQKEGSPFWPPRSIVGADSATGSLDDLRSGLSAIQIEIELEPFGVIRRIFPVVAKETDTYSYESGSGS